MPQCEFHKQDGERCRAKAMRGVGLCVSHNPAATKLKRAAASKGGRNRRVPKRATRPPKPIAIRSIDDVGGLLFRTLEELRNGVLDADLARSIGYLAGVTAKVVETIDLGRRVAALEEDLLKFSEVETN